MENVDKSCEHAASAKRRAERWPTVPSRASQRPAPQRGTSIVHAQRMIEAAKPCRPKSARRPEGPSGSYHGTVAAPGTYPPASDEPASLPHLFSLLPTAYKTILRTGNTAGKSPWRFGQTINKAGLPVFEVDESGHPTEEPRISNSPDFSSLIETTGPFGARKLYLITHFEAPAPGVQVRLPGGCRWPIQLLSTLQLQLLPAGQPRRPSTTALFFPCPFAISSQYVVELGQSPDGTLTPRSMKVGPAAAALPQMLCRRQAQPPLCPHLLAQQPPAAAARQEPPPPLLAHPAAVQPVDWSALGGLWNPCAGSRTPWGSHLGGEEYEPDARPFSEAADLASFKAQMDASSGYGEVEGHMAYWVSWGPGGGPCECSGRAWRHAVGGSTCRVEVGIVPRRTSFFSPAPSPAGTLHWTGFQSSWTGPRLGLDCRCRACWQCRPRCAGRCSGGDGHRNRLSQAVPRLQILSPKITRTLWMCVMKNVQPGR